MIFASTMDVYGDLGSFIELQKQCSVSKNAYAENSKLNFTILRYKCRIYSDAQPWNGISKYIKMRLFRQEKLNNYGSGNVSREYIHIEDAARLSVDMIDKNITEKAVNITGNQV